MYEEGHHSLMSSSKMILENGRGQLLGGELSSSRGL
jgi:hypothetical protein